MEKERARLHRDDPNYIPKLQAILTKETLFYRHQYGGKSATAEPRAPKPVGLEDYGGNTSITLLPVERAAARLKLAAWHLPSAFGNAVCKFHKRCRSREIFNDPGLSFLLDAWSLAEFARRKGDIDQVRMADPNEQWPDGYILVQGEVHNVEVTTALSPGRKMGEEYKFSQTTRFDSVDDWLARADALPQALEEAISRKIAKRYGSPVTLVVYLNISEYGVRQAQCRNAIGEIKSRYSRSFAGLHILWKDELL
jgi:hypothetical protein